MTDEQIIDRIIKEHPSWEKERIKTELYFRKIQQSPAYIDDSHVIPPQLRDQDTEGR